MILVVEPSRALGLGKHVGFSGRSRSLGTSTVDFVWKGQPERGASAPRTLTSDTLSTRATGDRISFSSGHRKRKHEPCGSPSSARIGFGSLERAMVGL
jgi:hypothetical protein